MINRDQILNLERSDSKFVRVKLIYIDIAGDFMAGVVLSEIMYWHAPDEEGKSRLRVPEEQEGVKHEWLACDRKSWFKRSRLTPRQFDQHVEKLVKQKLIFKTTFEYFGQQRVHVRANWDVLVPLYNQMLEAPPTKPTKVQKPAESDEPVTTKKVSRNREGVLRIREGVSPFRYTYLQNREGVSRNCDTKSTYNTKSTHTTNKEEKISPQGESPSPEPTVDPTPITTFIEEELFDDESKSKEPETPKVIFTDQQILMAAVQVGFGKGGGFAGMLGKQLTGKADKGQRKDWNIEQGMTPIEIVAFSIWYATDEGHNYEGVPPTTAETLYERVEEWRGVKDLDEDKFSLYMERGYTALKNQLAESPKVKKLKAEQQKNENLIDMSDDPIWDDLAKLAEGWD